MALPRTGKPRVPKGFGDAFVELQSIPNVGKAAAEDLVRLGVRGVKDLARRDPLAMYDGLCRLDGARHDPCVIDVFMSAVEFARRGKRRPWWAYTAGRKAMLARFSR
jgi:hypothetical protein